MFYHLRLVYCKCTVRPAFPTGTVSENFGRHSRIRNICPWDCGIIYRRSGRLAQPVRAPALHAGGQWFESTTAHQ